MVGIEDPYLQSPEAPNYFNAAWGARTFLRGADGRAPEREEVALVVNSAVVRGQDQLHIHVGCLLPSARRALATVAPKIPIGEWARIGAIIPHTMFWGMHIRGTDLSEVEPFRLAAQALADKAKDRGDMMIVVAGVRVESDDGFLILASYAGAPGSWWPVGAYDLLDPRCRPEPAPPVELVGGGSDTECVNRPALHPQRAGATSRRTPRRAPPSRATRSLPR